jgi:YgiT-type zinc finger domain-containing protein
MRCLYCQAEMKKGTAPLHIDRQGIHISLDDVPAWVCPQCGEPFFEEKDVDSIQGLIKAVEEQAASFSKSP